MVEDARDTGSGRDWDETNSVDGPKPMSGDVRSIVTFFEGVAATSLKEPHLSLADLAHLIRSTSARSKAKLPWLKLARFGDLRTKKNSLRHDANVQAITGIEADYDDKNIPFVEAISRLTAAGILSIAYTSPSHQPDAPRWRILCPTSMPVPPGQRTQLMDRLNGFFGGIFAPESWTLSQAYYFGAVGNNPDHEVALINGTPIDQRHELEANSLGKHGGVATRGPSIAGRRQTREASEAVLLADIVAGKGYHSACIRLSGIWAGDGISQAEARNRLMAAFDRVPEIERDQRWQDRLHDVDRCVDDIYAKEADGRGRKPAEPPGGSTKAALGRIEWPTPIDFLADAALTGVPTLTAEHVPAAIHDFAHDTAERMGVDPVSVALCCLVSCATVIHEDWRIQPKRHDDTWQEAARLWVAIVGDPSIRKTPVISVCTQPIDQLDIAARARHTKEMPVHGEALRVWKKSGSSPESMPRPPRMDRYLVEGATIEALSEILRDDEHAKFRTPSKRVLVRQDELTEWIAGFDRYSKGARGSADRGAYLRIFNGGRFTIDRIGRGGFAIPSWSACIVGGIQPGPIQRIAQSATDDGLLQRFVFCVPGANSVHEDREPNRTALQRYADLFPALVALHPYPDMVTKRQLANADTHVGQAPVFRLAAAGHQHRQDIDKMIDVISALPDTSARVRAALGKWSGLFARLVLTFHMIELAAAEAHCGQSDNTPEIPETTAARVAALMRDVLLPHLLRADAMMFSTEQTGHARWIAGFILARGTDRVTSRDVVQAYGPLRPPEKRRELLEVMESLVITGWLAPEEPTNPSRPVTAWIVNPAVHTRFAARAAEERERRSTARREIADTVSRLSRRKP